MTEAAKLELADIQSGAVRPRPTPYAATYLVFRVDDRKAGRELLRRAGRVVASAAHPSSPVADTWVSIALTYQGLRVLGVPNESLESFPVEFRQGMAARAAVLGDRGESSPENWEKPLGSLDVHVVMTVVAPDAEHLEAALAQARETHRDLTGVQMIWRQDCYALPDETEPFGFRDGMSHPAIQGSGIPGTNPGEQPLKAGEFILGYPDEFGLTPSIPQPDVLGRNGTYVVFRKLHQRVAAFRQYLKANSTGSEDEELLAAKMMGRWRSGAPLARCPLHDDPELGADPQRNNDFLYEQDDALGYKTPQGSHIRRVNPRDAKVPSVVPIHRMIRRGTAYGPLLPEGVLEDDGADRGLMFAFVGAHIGRQFEFVQSTWIEDSTFIGAGDLKDPIIGDSDRDNELTIPRRPVRRHLQGLPRFVVTRGGEYCFMPGLNALRWLADLDT
jgi:Dyp-type peroxidase family